MMHDKKIAESFKSLIEDFVKNETYWDTRVICMDGVVRHNKVTLGLIFHSLKTSDIFNLPVESSLIFPDFSTRDVQNMIENKLANILGGLNLTNQEHSVNIEEVVAVQFKIEQEDVTYEEIPELYVPEISFNKNEIESSTNDTDYTDEFGFDLETSEVQLKSLYDEIKKTSTKLTINGKERWSCSMCSQNVASLTKLKIHVARIHAEKNFKCSQCSFATGSLALLKTHKSIHNATAESCPICGKVVLSIKQHMRQVHESDGDQRHFCTECDKSYLRASDLTLHIDNFHLGLKEMCPICGKKLSLKKIQKHIKAVHEKEKRHFCPECGNGFFDKRDMEKHVDRVHREKKTLCNECGKEFSNISTHMKKCHSGLDLKVVCPECGKKVSKLVQHVDSVHRQIKNFQCPECPLKCYKKNTLDSHMERHKKGSPKKKGRPRKSIAQITTSFEIEEMKGNMDCLS